LKNIPIFTGEYHHLLDFKRRLAIPVKFRSTFHGKAVITKGMDGCLFLYPTLVWEKLAKKLGQLPLGEKKTRQFVRIILAGAVETEVDRQGRILVPSYLCVFAKLMKKVIISGLYDRLEIWDEREWEKTKQKAEREKERVAEELGRMGIY
jgi:MraZ protein